MAQTIRIGVLGCGTVGSQVVRLLAQRSADLAARARAELALVGIAVSRVEAERDEWVPRALLTADAERVVDASDLVIELIGGLEPARALITRALRAGKSVVTGNKALLAAHGPELFALARENEADLYYEAAVAGAVPVVYGLRESLAGDRVERVAGIVNGTTNYILDQMTSRGWDYAEALREAGRLGYAEADPTADVQGWDAAAKCALLAGLAFHTRVPLDQVSVRGITQITAADIADAAQLGRTIKLLAVAERVTTEDGTEAVSCRVEPTLVSNHSPLASVHGAFNAVVIDAEAAGRLMFYGQGAGGAPTASAVLGDVVAAAYHIAHGGSSPRESAYAALPYQESTQLESAARIRLLVRDELGVLEQVAGTFTRNCVSLHAVTQSPSAQGQAALALSTQVARRAQLHSTVEELKHLPGVLAVQQLLWLH